MEDVEALNDWLVDRKVPQDRKLVERLYKELQNKESHLELWSKRDGVDLMVRVCHILRFKVRDQNKRMLIMTHEDNVDGKKVEKNAYLTQKLNEDDPIVQNKAIDEADLHRGVHASVIGHKELPS